MISKFFSFVLLFLFGFTSLAQTTTISEIQIVGNERTKDRVLLRELLVFQDSTYPSNEIKERIQQSEYRLLNLNLFNSVKINSETTDINNTIQLTIVVVEKWYLWPIPFLEFGDRNFNVWQDLDFDLARTNYGLYVFTYNIGGRNHTLKTRLKTGYHDEIGFEYRIPFIGNSNTGLKFLIDYDAQDEVWLNTLNDQVQFYKNGTKSLIKTYNTAVEINHRFRWNMWAYGAIGFERGILDVSVDEMNDYFLNNENSQNTTTFKIGLKEDTRDNVFLPTKGYFVNPEIGYKHFQNSTSDQTFYFNLKAQTFNKLIGNIYAAASITGTTNTVSYLAYTNRKRLGYNEAIRGFEKYVVDGINGVNGTVALRYKLLDNHRFELPFIPIENYSFLPFSMFVETYAEGGFVYQEAPHISNQLPNERLGAVGVGLNMLFYNDRVVRLEYSYNSLQEGGFFVHFKKAI